MYVGFEYMYCIVIEINSHVRRFAQWVALAMALLTILRGIGSGYSEASPPTTLTCALTGLAQVSIGSLGTIVISCVFSQ